MSAIALELDHVLASLGKDRAEGLESAVREQIAKVTQEEAEWQRVMVPMKQNYPQAAEGLEAFADTEFQDWLQASVGLAKGKLTTDERMAETRGED